MGLLRGNRVLNPRDFRFQFRDVILQLLDPHRGEVFTLWFCLLRQIFVVDVHFVSAESGLALLARSERRSYTTRPGPDTYTTTQSPNMSLPTPSKMAAIEITGPGGPQKLALVTRCVPEPGPGEVLVKIAAAGVNRPDIMQREGAYPPPKGASDLPGLEVAGQVVALGPDVTELKTGQEVTALLAGGGYAEYCVASAPLALLIPQGLNMVEAACIPETFATVWTNVFERANLKSGETFLVHGGTSGIGTTAIQLAKAFGANVLTTAGSADKCAFCEELGADLAVPYQADDFVAAVKKFTDGRGVDVILDMVGGDYIQRNLDCLGTEGRLVQIAYLKGAKVELNLTRLLLKRLTLAGSVLRSRNVDEKACVMAGLFEHVWPLLEEKRVKPILDSTYPLKDAAEAHRRMETSQHIGKIVLIP